MTPEESLKSNGYAVVHGPLADWSASSLTAASSSSLVFCVSGSASVEVNMMTLQMSALSYVGFPQDSLIKLNSASDDFSAVELRCSYETGLAATVGLSAERLQSLFLYPNTKISGDKEVALLTHLLQALELSAQMPRTACHADLKHGLIRCLLTAMADICSSLNGDRAHSATFTTADSYFMNFISLLNKHCRQQHEVTFYADKLNITPKYLNEIVRKKVSHTAKEIITRYIVAQLKREILMSGNSVQRIAYEFNFCDQSSLGKFFKKATGMSPVAFRRSPR